MPRSPGREDREDLEDRKGQGVQRGQRVPEAAQGRVLVVPEKDRVVDRHCPARSGLAGEGGGNASPQNAARTDNATTAEVSAWAEVT